MFVQIKSFLQEHWKFCLSISLCIVFFAICLIIYMRTSEKSIEQPKTMKYEDTANTDKASHALHVDSGNARNITREIQYIHDGKTSPDVLCDRPDNRENGRANCRTNQSRGCHTSTGGH